MIIIIVLISCLNDYILIKLKVVMIGTPLI